MHLLEHNGEVKADKLIKFVGLLALREVEPDRVRIDVAQSDLLLLKPGKSRANRSYRAASEVEKLIVVPRPWPYVSEHCFGQAGCLSYLLDDHVVRCTRCKDVNERVNFFVVDNPSSCFLFVEKDSIAVAVIVARVA